MRKRGFLGIIIMTMAVLSVSWKPVPPQHPNFIVILADDLGWTSLSSGMDNRHPGYKSDYFETPNIDRLGNEGMRFSNGYAGAICTPSRRSIQFGQSTVKVGKKDFPEKYNPYRQKWLTIPWMLKSIDLNYRTAHYGKWDLRAGFSPEDLGYDESSGDTRNGNGDRIIDKSRKFTHVLVNGDPKRTVSLTGRALNFMKRQVASGHPFYMQVSYYATHVDLQTKKETYQKYLSKEKGAIHQDAGFAGMLEDMDTGIGKILDMVRELGIGDHTYIIFLTDNGGVEAFPPPSSRHKLDSGITYNYPLRGGKWVTYEGGIRVPFIISGPGVPSNSYCHIPVREFDILPTISDLADNKWTLPGYIDGGSIRPLFKNPENGMVSRPKKDFYFHRFTPYYLHSAVIEGNYKLLIRWRTDKGFKKTTTELYNLDKDIKETNDLSQQLPEKVSELQQKLVAYLKRQHIEIPYEDLRSNQN